MEGIILFVVSFCALLLINWLYMHSLDSGFTQKIDTERLETDRILKDFKRKQKQERLEAMEEWDRDFLLALPERERKRKAWPTEAETETMYSFDGSIRRSFTVQTYEFD